jgi:hypothetical protein
MVVGPDVAWNQYWLCWRVLAAIYLTNHYLFSVDWNRLFLRDPTEYVSPQSFTSGRKKIHFPERRVHLEEEAMQEVQEFGGH